MLRRCRATLVPFAILLSASSAIAAELKTALIIGNNAYPKAELLNSVNDAKAVAQELKGLGFDVTLLTDVAYAKIAEQFDLFAKKVSGVNDAVAIVYYSGHGIQMTDRNLLLATDITTSNIDQKSIDIQKWLASFKPGSNASYLVILDACRQYSPSGSKNGLAPIDAPPGTLIAFSTAPGRVALDGDAKDVNGTYTKHLIKYLKTPGVPVESIFKKVRAGVLAETHGDQLPWENSSMLRDFYFLGAPVGYVAPITSKQETDVNAGGSVSKLTAFYDALTSLKGKSYVSSKDLQAINNLFKPASGIEVNAGEAKYLADKMMTVGAFVGDLPDFIREKYGITKGVGGLVNIVEDGGVASRLGIRRGDIVIQVNGKDFHGLADAIETQKNLKAGEILTATVLRDGEEIKVSGIVERASVENIVIYMAWEKYFAEGNFSKARQLLEAVAVNGNPRALGLLASLAFNGQGYDSKQRELGYSYAVRAAENGGWEGASWVAMATMSGLGTEENKQKSIELLKQYTARNEGWAYGMLAFHYIKGNGVTEDYAKAKEYAEKGAYLGNIDAIMSMGILYEDGLGVQKNSDEAIRWYTRAKEVAGPNKQMQGNIDFKIKAAKNVLGGFGVLLDALSGKK